MNLIEKAAQHLEGLPKTEPMPSPSTPDLLTVWPSAAQAGIVTSEAPASIQVEIDLGKLSEAGFVMPDAPRSMIAEEFRVLKRPLLANVAGRPGAPIRHPNLIMVTSAMPKEGKSFTALNLAMSIAMELERTVLLVDADVAQPSLPTLLGLPPRKGLLDVLEDKSLPLSEVLLRTNVDKLNLLMAGTPQARATELLASQAMASLLEEMAERYPDRIVIFDSPPLLVTTEARVLATQMGQIVFVVRAEHTLQSAVKEALGTIAACPVKYMVLNQSRSLGQTAYGYGYGYDR
jgi:exopolysaccharide/PEP-CTERM locus tyrosine autokinase